MSNPADYRCGGAASAEGAAALPCQDTIISNERIPNSQSRKVAYALKENVAAMIEKHGVERIGFLTLTFADKVQNIREAQRRFNSLRTGVLAPKYVDWIGVMQRHASGVVHFHLLVVCPSDIRTGLDFEALKKKDYRSANDALRAQWAFWRKTAPRYSFGRTELLPLRSTGVAVAKYVSRYIGKHLNDRRPEDKGAKLVRYSRGANKFSSRFTWNSAGSYVWRQKCALLAVLTKAGQGMQEVKARWREWYGSRWVYKLRPVFGMLRLSRYPSGRHWNADHSPHDHVHPDIVDIEPAFQFDLYGAISHFVTILGRPCA